MVLVLQYISDKSDSVKEASKIIKRFEGKDICYVTLSKSCRAMKEFFDKEGLNSDRVYYIDCISSTIREPKKLKGCSYVENPYDLNSIAEEIKKAIRAGSSVVIFDSLSDLLAYGTAVPAGMNILIDFIRSFSRDLENKKGAAIFLCRKSDEENFLIEETVPVFDKVIGGRK